MLLARAFLWPDSFELRVGLEVGYRIITFAAAIQLVRFRWARWEIGPWLLTVELVDGASGLGPVERLSTAGLRAGDRPAVRSELADGGAG